MNEGDFFTANFRCIDPELRHHRRRPAGVPARAALYGHGLLGSASETSASHVRAFASEHNFVFCGTDWTGFAEDDEAYVGSIVLANFSNFPNFIERQHQGVLELPGARPAADRTPTASPATRPSRSTASR